MQRHSKTPTLAVEIVDRAEVERHAREVECVTLGASRVEIGCENDLEARPLHTEVEAATPGEEAHAAHCASTLAELVPSTAFSAMAAASYASAA